MNTYHASFCILGEVTEMLVLHKPVQRMLIDISARPDTDRDAQGFVYRTSFSATKPKLICDLQDQVSPGDVIEAKGTFWQSGFVPHRQGYVDTTFCLSGFRLIEKKVISATRYNPYQSLFPYLNLH